MSRKSIISESATSENLCIEVIHATKEWLQNNAWQSGLTTNKLRLYLSSAFLGQDEWWIGGGTSGSSGSLSLTTTEMLYSGTDKFVNYNDLPEEMEDHTMVRVNETTVIFVGNNPQSDRVYIFHKDTQTYNNLPSLTVERAYPFAGKMCTECGKFNKLPPTAHFDSLIRDVKLETRLRIPSGLLI